MADSNTAEIPHVKVTLDNGLQVIVHEDRHCPIVAVNLWYHVGSKNERPGRTGFAHLFEHLMFEGSAHQPDSYFRPLQEAGAALNGSTSPDRTNYWEVVPRGALERALWMESDRMGHLLPALTQEKLDNQRDVVLNERRQRYENQPYGMVSLVLDEAHYPPDHPYHWPVIGSVEDLRAADLDQVREFFAAYYHPANASLVVAGDVAVDEAIERVEAYFGDIPAGDAPAPVVPPAVDPRARAASLLLSDRVELPRLYLTWPSASLYAEDDAELDLASEILAGGKSSRLYRALLHDRQWAADVSAHQYSQELSGMFGVIATAAPGRALGDLDRVITGELARLAADGPSDDELGRARNRLEADFAARRESIGGFGGRSDLLNNYNVMAGRPDYLAEDLARYTRATREGVAAALGRRLDPAARIALSVVPAGAADRALDGATPVEAS